MNHANMRLTWYILDMSEVIQIRPSEKTIHRASRGFVTPKRGRWKSLTRGLYCWVSYMVRNSLNEFTPCFFSAALSREGVEDPLLLFLFIVDTVYSKPGPLSGVLINSAHSHLPSSNKRKTPIHILYLIYPGCMGQKCAWPAKGNVWGVT